MEGQESVEGIVTGFDGLGVGDDDGNRGLKGISCSQHHVEHDTRLTNVRLSRLKGILQHSDGSITPAMPRARDLR